jgi:hypothetical protein
MGTMPRGRAARGAGQNKVGFAGYEVGISGLSILAQYELTRHGHRKLACLAKESMWGSSVTPLWITTGSTPRLWRRGCGRSLGDEPNVSWNRRQHRPPRRMRGRYLFNLVTPGNIADGGFNQISSALISSPLAHPPWISVLMDSLNLASGRLFRLEAPPDTKRSKSSLEGISP